MPVKFNNPAAFEPFSEPVVWRQDAEAPPMSRLPLP